MAHRLIGKVSFVIWQLVQLPFLLVLFVCTAAFVDKSANGWVISGHRGRMKADNSASLFDFISQQTRQSITWIGGQAGSTLAMFPNAVVVPRHTLRARYLIARAPVLIYSHGEDDLDCLLFLLRRFLGTRVYIGHGSNLLKRAFMHPEESARQGFLRSLAINWLSDYDVMICSSEAEKKFWDANQPLRKQRHFVCGGAPRLDAILPLTKLEPTRRIVYAPTFRETSKGSRSLLRNLQALTQSDRLGAWLEEQDFELIVVCHINTFRSGMAMPSGTARIALVAPDHLWESLSIAACLVTDYSSIMFDWLLFDRPAVFFPFDMDEFLQTRGFHQTYEQYVYGNVAANLDELVEILTSGTWQGNVLHQARVRELRSAFSPNPATCNSLNVYKAICELSGSRQDIVSAGIGTGKDSECSKTTSLRQI